MTTNQLKYIVLTGLFVIPFVPLFVSTSLFFPFITGKGFAFRLIVEVILVAYLVLAIREPDYRPKFSWILASLTAFLIVMGIADFFGANPFKSFWSNYERMEGYITLLHLFAYFVVMSSVMKTKNIWNNLLLTSLGASVIMAIYCFFQLAGKITINQGGVRVDGTLGNASYLGIYMLFHIFFAALLATRFRSRGARIGLAIISLMNLTILYYTATRGAILGLLGGALVTFLFLVFKSQKGDKIRKFAGVGILVLVIIVGTFLAVKDRAYVKNNPVLGRFSSLSVSEIKTQGRFFVWPIAVKGFLEKPILGWGQEGFNFVFNKYYDPRMYTQEPWFDRTHNFILDWLIAGGALGLLTYLSIIFSLLYYILRTKADELPKENKAIILGLISAYLFHNLFVFDQISSYILFFTVLAYAHSEVNYQGQPILWRKIATILKSVVDSIKWRPVLESAVVVVFVLVLYFGEYLPWKQNKDLLAVLRLANDNQVGTLETYKKPLSGYGMGFSESLEHVSQAALVLGADARADVEIKKGVFDLVDKSFAKHLARVPDDARYRLFYGIFLSRFGQYDRAIEQLQEGLSLSPQKQGIAFELINNLLLTGKMEEALTVAKTAYEGAPSYQEAKLVYGLVAISAGQNDLGNSLLMSLPESLVTFDDRYVSVLLSLKQYQKIIDVAKRRVELEPTELKHRLTLTAAYLEANRNQDAIETLREVIRLDPTFKEKGEYYIKEIQAGRKP